jgi:2',3'-cyclic-nucleotide 2'-phosphodiesterase (5'-nucleotidase family)
MKKIFVLFLITLLSICVYSQDNIKDVIVFHWNDLHARDLPFKVSKKDSATGKTTYYYVGGTSDMLGYLNKYRTKNSLVLNAGDDYTGTPVSSITRGRSQIELLNLYHIDAFVFGNHEFDYGQYSLDSAMQLANFDYISSNVYFNPKHSTLGKPYLVKDIGGVKFGIIGITLPDLIEATIPSNISEITMLNLDSVLKSDISLLKKEKCNVIILLTHEGVDADKLLAEKYYKDVDVIVGGHSHTPLFKPVIDSGVIIVQAGAFSRWLGELDLKVDMSKDTVIGYSGKLIETVMDSSIYDKAAEQKVESMVASIGGDLMRVIGKLESDWRASYMLESNLGQFEADAFREKTGADIAFINGGGLRKNLMQGDIKVTDIWEINPFGDELITFSVNGKMLKQMLINNTRIRLLDRKDGNSLEILDVSGLTYSYDSKQIAEDNNNVNVYISVNGLPLDEAKDYSIATNNFVTSQFKMFFGDLPEQVQFKGTGLIDRDVIIEKVEKQKMINSPFEKRITDLSNPK